MMNKTIDSLKNVASLLPFFGGFIILYGGMKAVFYYDNFDIDIISYLTFGEFVTYFMKDIQVVFFSFIFFVVIILLFDKSLRSLTKKKEISSDEAVNENSKLSASTIKTTLLIGLVSGTVLLVTISIFTGDWTSFFKTSLLFAVSFAVIKLANDVNTGMIIIFLTGLLITASFGSIREARLAKEGRYFGVNFNIKGSQVISDSVNYFIGKTENYIFYYRSREKKTDVYKVGDLESMVIPNKD